MELRTRIIFGFLVCAVIFCMIKILMALHSNHKSKIKQIQITAYNSALTDENSRFRAKFFVKCSEIRETVLAKKGVESISEYLSDFGFKNAQNYIDALTESVTKFVLSHEDSSNELVDIFCVVGLFRILLLCDNPSILRSAGYEEPWYKYTLHGDLYPKDSITRYLGSMDAQSFQIERLYFLVDTLIFDERRFDEFFIDGKWLNYSFDLQDMLHELDERPFVKRDIIKEFGGNISLIELRPADVDSIKHFICATIVPQMD